MPRTSFRVNLHSIVCLNFKELLAWSRFYIWSLSDSNGSRTQNHLVCKRTLNQLVKLAKWLSLVMIELWSNYWTVLWLSYSSIIWLSVPLETKWLWVRIPLLSEILITIIHKTGGSIENVTLWFLGNKFM